jgi:hypothetical protein
VKVSGLLAADDDRLAEEAENQDSGGSEIKHVHSLVHAEGPSKGRP